MTRDKLYAWLKLRQEELRAGRWWVALNYGDTTVGVYSDGHFFRERHDGHNAEPPRCLGAMVGMLDEEVPW